MLSAVDLILGRMSKARNRRKDSGTRDERTDGDTLKRGSKEKKKVQRVVSSEDSNDESSIEGIRSGNYSSASDSGDDNRSRKSVDSSSKSKKSKSTKKSTKKAGTKKEKSSKKHRQTKSNTDSASDEDNKSQEPDFKMSRRYKSEELLNVPMQEDINVKMKSLAVSTLCLSHKEEERKVKHKQLYLELKRKQENARKSMLAEQRALRQHQEPIVYLAPLQGTKTIEKPWFETNLDLEYSSGSSQTQSRESSSYTRNIPDNQRADSISGSELHSVTLKNKSQGPIVPPKPRKKYESHPEASGGSVVSSSSGENILQSYGDTANSSRKNQNNMIFPAAYNPINQNSNIKTNEQTFQHNKYRASTASHTVRYDQRVNQNISQHHQNQYNSSSLPRSKQAMHSQQYNQQPVLHQGNRHQQGNGSSGPAKQLHHRGPAMIPYNQQRGSPILSNRTVEELSGAGYKADLV